MTGAGVRRISASLGPLFIFTWGTQTVTRNGALVAATDDTSPEMTDSKMHEVLVEFGRRRPSAAVCASRRVWRDLAHDARAVVGAELPDKYRARISCSSRRCRDVRARCPGARPGKVAAGDCGARRANLELSLERLTVLAPVKVWR